MDEDFRQIGQHLRFLKAMIEHDSQAVKCPHGMNTWDLGASIQMVQVCWNWGDIEGSPCCCCSANARVTLLNSLCFCRISLNTFSNERVVSFRFHTWYSSACRKSSFHPGYDHFRLSSLTRRSWDRLPSYILCFSFNRNKHFANDSGGKILCIFSSVL